MEQEAHSSDRGSRREFLKKCGKFAAVTPPAITMLLSTSLTSDAIAKSNKGQNRASTMGNKFGWDQNGKR